MRRLAGSLALGITLLLASSTSFGQEADAGPTSAPAAMEESLPMRIGKAVLFGVAASALLVLAGGRWKRAGRRARR